MSTALSESSHFAEIRSDCCGCSSRVLVSHGADYLIQEGRVGGFSVVECTHCGLAYTLPEMSEAELEPFYPEVFEAFQRRTGFKNWLLQQKYRSEIREIEKRVGKGASIFEVGAGRGEFLYALKQSGFAVSGLEFSALGCEAARANFGIELIHSGVENFVFSEKVNCVVLRHTLEHFSDPQSVLRNIFENGLLNRGVIFIKVPNCRSWEAHLFGKYWKGWELPRHRFHFNQTSLQWMMERAGFSGIESKYEAVPTTAIDSMKFVCLYGKSSLLRTLFKLGALFPSWLCLMIAQVVVLILQPFRSGRMIFWGKKGGPPDTSRTPDR